MAAGGFGRPPIRRSGECKNTKWCQTEAQDKYKEDMVQGEGSGCTTVIGNGGFASGGWRSSELESGGQGAWFGRGGEGNGGGGPWHFIAVLGRKNLGLNGLQ